MMDAMGEYAYGTNGDGPPIDYDANPFGSWCVFCSTAWWFWFSSGFDLIICTIYFVPATILFYIHCKNYCLNLTSYERFSRR